MEVELSLYRLNAIRLTNIAFQFGFQRHEMELDFRIRNVREVERGSIICQIIANYYVKHFGNGFCTRLPLNFINIHVYGYLHFL